jgi:curved DNA-binding protein CbpA
VTVTRPSRPHPSAEGRFGKTPFAHVLLYIREHALSGTLAVDGPTSGPLAGEHFFVFERGSLAQSWIATGLDRLGDILLERKLINAQGRRDADVILAAAPQLTGDVYREMGLVDQDAIVHSLVEQTRRRALRIFSLGNATYRFYQDINLLDGFGRERYPVDVLSIVWRGVLASPPNATIEVVLQRVGNNPLSLRANAQLDAFEFGDDVQPLLDVLRLGPATMADLRSFSKDPELPRLLAYVLLVSKQVDATLIGAQSDLAQNARGAAPAQRATTHETPSSPHSPSAAVAAKPAPSLGPVQLPTSTTKDVGSPTMNDQSPAAASSNDPHAREAEALFATMDEQNYYEMLGVPKNASVDDIRVAFMKLAARWHPDRAPSAPAKEAYQRVFAMINEAHQTLSDDTLRNRYNRIAADGGGTPAAQRKVHAMLEASTLAQKADIHLKRREYAEAERLAREAAALHREDTAVLTVLGATLLEQGTPETLAEALSTLEEAVALAEKNDRAHTLLAQCFKRKGDENKALEHFKLAVEANPKNIDAAREVRLAELRARATLKDPTAKSALEEKSTTDKPTAAGLLSKLFKR